MNNITKTKNFIKKELEWLCSAHDLHHINRVYKISETIFLEDKKWNKEIILISALLHEMLDNKFFEWVLEKQKEKIENFLNSLELNKQEKEKITYIVENIWYWKSLSWKKIDKFIEFQIVEDADRLESIWAIAIARTFAYWWKKHIPIYDPEIKVELDMTPEEYRNHKWTSINHFYEKLLKLKYLMNTNFWKKIAKDRHKFMETFLEQFFWEWNWEK